ncbi:hypothetical protein Pan44_48060 [Caulifigura coniformis]|uniref:Uncharacterized protein n=1 Tax=Caulifigura coniformis TaxID=2527983 RepID=A0A517SKV1_9PLAN|nr:hypothetical protein Pan44_48060 [Caulifigura coniformis]
MAWGHAFRQTTTSPALIVGLFDTFLPDFEDNG